LTLIPMLALASASVGLNTGLAPVVQQRAAAPVMRRGGGETVDDLKALAEAQKIPMGYWDPLGMTKLNLYDFGEEGTIGWLRHAEIKHGRVAMAAFVGFCVQSNGIFFPWALTGGPLAEKAGDASTMYADLAAIPSPVDQWDAVPAAGKLQIILTIGLLEIVGENLDTHYTKGGKPGYYPPLKEAQQIPHDVPFNLYDPFNLFAKQSAESKARGLNVEINNGRAAMLGIFGLISASKGLIVPGLDNLGIAQSSGEPMAYFGPNDALPFVEGMYSQPFIWN